MPDPVSEWLGTVRRLDGLLRLCDSLPQHVQHDSVVGVPLVPDLIGLQRLEEQPPLPQKLWRRLVLQEQVCTLIVIGYHKHLLGGHGTVRRYSAATCCWEVASKSVWR